MGRAIANTITALFGALVVLAFFPSKTLARYSSRVANRLVGWMLDGAYFAAYAAADAFTARRARRRAAAAPEPAQEDSSERAGSEQQPEDAGAPRAGQD